MKTVYRRTWIHFVGSSYYSMSDFIKEASSIGISRAVSPAIFKKMLFGDLILLAQWDGKKSIIFGGFTFSSLIGLSEQALVLVEKSKLVTKSLSFKPVPVDRGCGTYVITGSYSVANPNALMQTIAGIPDDELGRVMIGGEFEPLSTLLNQPETKYVTAEIHFRKGFRRFDYESFKDDCVAQRIRTRMTIDHYKVKGHFYLYDEDGRIEENPHPVNDASLFQIKDYQLN